MIVFELMRSKFWMAVAGLSLVVAAILIAVLVRSFTFYDGVIYSNLQRTYQLFTVPGSLVLSTWDHLPLDDFSSDYISGLIDSTNIPLYRDGRMQNFPKWDHPAGMKLGFWFEHGSVEQTNADGSPLFTQTHYNVAMPIVLLALALLVPPIAWGLKLLQRYRRAKAGRCIFCNTQMPTPDQCPHCGAEYERWAA